MVQKVLIVEDLDSIGYGISSILKKELGINNIITSQYCDDAYLKFLRAKKDGEPFDLVITDLSFKKDYRKAQLRSGKEMIEKIRFQDEMLPILVYSVEERKPIISELINNHQVNAYVIKGRDGLKSMVMAIKTIMAGDTYLSHSIKESLQQKDPFVVEDYDVLLMKQLSYGLTQDQIASVFQERGVSPSSLSSIEKRLNRLKEELKAKNTIQLVANAKDLGFI